VTVTQHHLGDKDAEHDHADEHVAKRLVGPEQSLALRLLRVRHAVAAEDRDVGDEQDDHEGRHDAGVQGVEAGQRRVAVGRTADDDLLHPRPHHGHLAGDVGRHLGGPEALLVPRQQVAGQPLGEGQGHQGQAEPPVDLALTAAGAGDDHLEHVQTEQHHHHAGAEVVQAADEPAEFHLILDEMRRSPSSCCRPGCRRSSAGRP
jgi:hypothetical protein